jgi:hypothetical protein
VVVNKVTPVGKADGSAAHNGDGENGDLPGNSSGAKEIEVKFAKETYKGLNPT